MYTARANSSYSVPVVLLFATLALSGCQTAYYGTLEKFGIHKRDILVDRVKDARDTQEETKEQFQTALERFTEVLNFDGGSLETKYKRLNTEFEKSEEKAQAVHDRVDSVQDVAEDLFREWKQELSQYSNDSLRRSSERQLVDTQRRYQQLIAAMRRAETKIDPVLSAFRDQVLFLKHNLNARAIASLRGELVSVESDIAALVRDMEASINESNAFINELESTRT